MSYKALRFRLKPFSFKHTGLFPEQATNWEWIKSVIENRIGKTEPNPTDLQTIEGPNASVTSGSSAIKTNTVSNGTGKRVRVLNLFAYTGGATLAASLAGADVTHVDASKGMVTWAKENAEASGLRDRKIRWLVDDCVKFVEREIRRGKKYEGIIMDPPSYGRGPKGEIWKMEEQIYTLLQRAALLLSEQPLFFLLNAYSTGLQPGVLAYLLKSTLPSAEKWQVDAGELGLPVSAGGLLLPSGISGRAVCL
ncbi:MAG: class I SAM-dependent methyltransferase [Lachnospiraceae bacterium]|nr:class I SAM-dependent methyltransferase [Lachnospiraceae bacterium]